MSKGAPRFVEFNFFYELQQKENGFDYERRRGDLQSAACNFIIFAWGLTCDLSKFSDDFTEFIQL